MAALPHEKQKINQFLLCEKQTVCERTMWKTAIGDNWVEKNHFVMWMQSPKKGNFDYMQIKIKQNKRKYCEVFREAMVSPPLEILKHDWRSPEQTYPVRLTTSKTYLPTKIILWKHQLNLAFLLVCICNARKGEECSLTVELPQDSKW